MWLAVSLAVVALALVLVVVFGVHAWSRFRRMKNFGVRAGERVSRLADDAGALADRVDDLSERSEAIAESVAHSEAERSHARSSGLRARDDGPSRPGGRLPARAVGRR